MRETIAKQSHNRSPSRNLNEFKLKKSVNLKPYYFQDSDMQLIQANDSLDDEDNEEKRFSLTTKTSLKSICSNDGGSLVEIYTPRSIKCYNISNENSNEGQESANMLLEMKFEPKSDNDCTHLPITLTCDNRIKNPVARTVLNSLNLLQSRYAT